MKIVIRCIYIKLIKDNNFNYSKLRFFCKSSLIFSILIKCKYCNTKRLYR